MEPRLEAVGVTQAGETSPGSHESFLGGVFGSAVISQDQPGNDVEPIDRDACQLSERGRNTTVGTVALVRVA
jgi:hypothetical protein